MIFFFTITGCSLLEGGTDFFKVNLSGILQTRPQTPITKNEQFIFRHWTMPQCRKIKTFGFKECSQRYWKWRCGVTMLNWRVLHGKWYFWTHSATVEGTNCGGRTDSATGVSFIGRGRNTLIICERRLDQKSPDHYRSLCNTRWKIWGREAPAAPETVE